MLNENATPHGEVLPQFKNPPHEYGEVAFFWWHGDKITKEKLLWILGQLEDKHICGLQINYAHGDTGGRRHGLTLKSDPVPFSTAWWELIEWFVGECKKRGMTVSLSDYTLASPGQGFYTDWLVEKHPEMIGKRLLLNENGEVEIREVPFSINPIAAGVGDAYIDESFAAFERHLPGECGKGINFFFSDELSFNVRGNLWCDDFREEFIKRKGYDITEKWEAIFRDVGDETPKIRLDYYDVIVQLSEERYFKPVYDWHEARGMTFGCDHGGRGRDITEFGDYFRTMKWHQGPGNDQPFLRSSIVKSKISSSIAHMYRRPRVWLEGFYSSGWATDSADLTDAIFRNFALGHNLLSLHGLYYSTHGSMWEWAPPCNHHHMPYWGQMGTLLGATKRLSYLLAEGTHRADVAIVYPVAAAEADTTKDRKEIAAPAFDIATHLYTHGIDFDFIDFESIERAEVINGELCVSDEQFKTVIVPAMSAVRFGMMEKLHAFAKAGGQVLFLGCVPTASDRVGRNDERLNAIVKEALQKGALLQAKEEIAAAISARYVLDFAVPSANPFHHHRVIGGKDLYLIYRVPEGTPVRLRATGTPVILNPWDGSRARLKTYTVKTLRQGGHDTEVTEFNMPLTQREVLLVLFEKDASLVADLPIFAPPTERDTKLVMEGEWTCELLPTMDNTYGDWRLPATNGFIGAEARGFTYCYCKDEPTIPPNAEWKHSFYSYGTHFYIAEGERDEQKLIAATAPTEEMREYRYSTQTGVEGDAGHQHSYHGLKGYLSDEFLVMGQKTLTYANSSSKYEGEGPYYFFTTVWVDEETEVQIETGAFAPDRIFIDHKEITEPTLTLSRGRHYVLLRFPHGGRSYFVLKRASTFKVERPLVTSWFENPDVLPFDAMPRQSGGYCAFRFTAPPGATQMKVHAKVPVIAKVGERTLTPIRTNEFALDGGTSALEITLFARESEGLHDTALLTDPIEFQTASGIYDVGRSASEQGLDFYSGGISLRKTLTVARTDNRTFLVVKQDFGSAAEVFINGKHAAVLLTPPYRCDVTKLIREGENDVEVRVFSDLHNHMKTIPTNYNEKIDVDTIKF